MKIAFVSTILSFPLGGADTLWTHAAEAAVDRGDEILIAVSAAVAASSRVAALRAAGAAIHEHVPAVVPTSIAARIARKLGPLVGHHSDPLVAALAAFRPGLVIFSLGGTYDLIAYPAWAAWLRASGTEFQIIANWQQEHSVLTKAELKRARGILTAACRVNFVSTRNLEATRRHLLLPLPNARVIQNPLRWRSADVAPWPQGPLARLATVSRLDEGKGIQLLLEALAAAAPTLPAWQLNIFGEGPYESALRQLAGRLGFGERVRFRGYAKDLRAIWAENQLMISPAIDDGVPMTIPEAMFCQRPVLATRVGGADDWLKHGATGFLCPAPEAPRLAASLHEAFAAQEHWEMMGQAAAEAAARHYRADDYLQLIAR